MQHIKLAKKKKIISALPKDAQIDWESLDAAIGSYPKMRESGMEIRRNFKAERTGAKPVQDNAFKAYNAINEFLSTINEASSSIQHTAKTSGLSTGLEKIAFQLAPWTNIINKMPKGRAGGLEELERGFFIRKLQTFFRKITGKSRKVSYDAYAIDNPYGGEFYNFVVACAGDLPGFNNLKPGSIADAIKDALADPL